MLPRIFVSVLTVGIGFLSAKAEPPGETGPLAGVLAGTEFTYQGRLFDGGVTADGTFDMTFRLFNLPNVGVQIGGNNALNDVSVVDGRFTVVLDFGDQFNQAARFLEVEIDGQILSPRQQVHASPLSLFSRNTRGIDVASNGYTSIGTTDHDGVLTVKGGSQTVWLDSPASNAVVLRTNATANSGDTFSLIAGNSSPDGHAIFASHTATTGSTPAILGTTLSTSSNAAAIIGRVATNTPGSFSAGVKGEAIAANSILGIGVWGEHASDGMGVFGKSPGGIGVFGSSADGYGGWFQSTDHVALIAGTGEHLQIGDEDIAHDDLIIEDSDARIGLFSNGGGAAGSAIMLREMISGSVVDNWSIVRETSGVGASLAFTYGPDPGATTNPVMMDLNPSGDLNISGNLSKGGGSFLIDHPLDPINKYLAHSFVESPDMMNIYNGNVTTDEHGYSTIDMPEWFDALNRDFRYQLTVIDDDDSESFTLAKVVRRLRNNQFIIRTSQPYATVSWQVTGIRDDAYARMKPIEVERIKPADERGRYLHPAAFGAAPTPMISDD